MCRVHGRPLSRHCVESVFRQSIAYCAVQTVTIHSMILGDKCFGRTLIKEKDIESNDGFSGEYGQGKAWSRFIRPEIRTKRLK